VKNFSEKAQRASAVRANNNTGHRPSAGVVSAPASLSARARRAVRAAVLGMLLLGTAVPHICVADDAIQVPARYRLVLDRAAVAHFGPAAPTARFAAQIHAESSWRPTAESPYAAGLSQFTPATADWIADLYPDLRPAAPWDPGWSMRAQIRYMDWIHRRVPGFRDPADRWAATLAGYNGGLGWIRREQRAARDAGDAAERWWHGVDRHCLRAQWACRENRRYPLRVMCELEPRYARAGWRGNPLTERCP